MTQAKFNQLHDEHDEPKDSIDLSDNSRFQDAWEEYWHELLAESDFEDRRILQSREENIYWEFMSEYSEKKINELLNT